MKRRDFVRAVPGAVLSPMLAAAALAQEKSPPPDRPNIVLFLVDDMGWQDTSVPFWTEQTLFNKHFRTPNMERLARQGVRFTNAYSQAVCSPTRTSIMTGQNAVRHHVTNWTLWPDRDQSGGWGRVGAPEGWRTEGIQPEDPTLARLLHDDGYYTIHCGKAHWGAYDTPGSDPCNLGFDVNIAGHAAGGPGSYQGEENYGNKELGGHTRPWGVPGLEDYHGSDVHLTDALTREACEAVERSVETGKPFYLYMAHYAVHAPIQPHRRFMPHYENREYPETDIDIPPAEEKYASMVEGMDASLGALLNLVDALGQAENTLVIFTSDNGGFSVHARGTTPRGTGANTHNWPLKAGKGSAYEGGTRVPYIAAWARPDSANALQRQLPLQAGSESDQPIIVEDLYPTLLGIGGAQGRIPDGYPVDGRDIRQYLTGRASDPDRPLYFHYPHVWGPHGPGYEPHSTMRVGSWKIAYFYNRRRWELYNIQDDIGETNDLAEEHPDRLRAMASRMKKDFLAMDAQWPVDRRTGKQEPLMTPDELDADDLEIPVAPAPAAVLQAIKSHAAAPHILADPDWYTWGASVVQGDDRKYHLFYSRWPREFGFFSWLTHSEIAHAVADKPEGPYAFVETALKARGEGHWDQITAHNPKIKKFGDKYYLYYCSTNGDVPESELVETARVSHKHPNWAILRPNQRTGVAVADSLEGPWQRFDQPIIEPAGPITTLTVNPAIAQGPDGRYYLIVKGDKPGETRFIRNQAIAVADSPTGPFTIQPEPAVGDLDTEDASMWYDPVRRRFYAVFHAHTFIGMITSRDGIHWSRAGQFRFMPKGIPLDDGTTWVPDRMERPFIMTDADGQPQMLFVACKKGDDAVNVALSLRAV